MRPIQVWGGTEERSDAKANGVKSGIGGARGRGRGTGSNLLLLLAYLYNYGVAHCTLVYDIIGLLVDGACLVTLLVAFSSRCCCNLVELPNQRGYALIIREEKTKLEWTQVGPASS